MNILQKIAFIVAVCLSSSVGWNAIGAPGGTTLPIEKGVLDLSNVDLHQTGLVRLDGDWEFYWQELIEPGSFPQHGVSTHQSIYTNWSKVKGVESDLGFATYRLIVRLGDEIRGLSIKKGPLGSASKIWVNGELLFSGGIVGQNSAGEFPIAYQTVVDFGDQKGDLEIVIQVSSFNQTGTPTQAGYPGSISNLDRFATLARSIVRR